MAAEAISSSVVASAFPPRWTETCVLRCIARRCGASIAGVGGAAQRYGRSSVQVDVAVFSPHKPEQPHPSTCFTSSPTSPWTAREMPTKPSARRPRPGLHRIAPRRPATSTKRRTRCKPGLSDDGDDNSPSSSTPSRMSGTSVELRQPNAMTVIIDGWGVGMTNYAPDHLLQGSVD